MTHEEFIEKIHDDGRIVQEMRPAEMAEALNIVATDMMAGMATVAHADTLLGIRFALMTQGERKVEHNDLSRRAAAGVVEQMPRYNTQQVAVKLGVATSTVTLHARKLRLAKRGRDYLLAPADIEALRQSMAASRPGRPRAS